MRILKKREEIEVEIRKLEKIEKLNPENLRDICHAYFTLALKIAEKSDEPIDKCIDKLIINLIILKKYDNCVVWGINDYARTFTRYNRPNTAIKLYQTVLSLDSQNYIALMESALVYYALSMDNKGLANLNKASKIEAKTKQFALDKVKPFDYAFQYFVLSLIDYSSNRTSAELFLVYTDILRFFKNENLIERFSFIYVLHMFVARFNFHNKQDLVLDVLSEVKTTLTEDISLWTYLSAMEHIVINPNLLEKVWTLRKSFPKYYLNIERNLPHYRDTMEIVRKSPLQKSHFDIKKKSQMLCVEKLN